MGFWQRIRQKLFGQKKTATAEEHFRRGIGKLAVGDYSGALREWNTALELDPAFAPAYYHRALLYEAQGKLNEAVSDLLNALEIFERQKDQAGIEQAKKKLEEISNYLEENQEL